MCDSQWGQLNGQFIIVVRNQQHVEALMKSESQLLISLIKNHIPVVFKEDVHMFEHALEIILDYFNQPIEIIETNILSFQTLIQKSIYLRPIPKLRQLRKNRKTSSTERVKKPNGYDRMFAIMNIEKKLEQVKKDEIYVFKDLSKCVDPWVIKGFNNDYEFGVFIVIYEKLGLSHIEILNEVVKLYIQERNSKTLSYLSLWLDYRQVDLINDNSAFCTIFQQFLNLVELIATAKQQLQDELQMKITNILNGKKNILTTTLNTPSPTLLQRKQSLDHPQKSKRFRNLSMQISNQSIIQNISSEFDGNQFYLNCNIEILQKQFWIIDIEQFSKISITAMLNQNHLIKYCQQQFTGIMKLAIILIIFYSI
ncbi:unnamed protein product [Paramecium octaurelia]|uniref:Uncharacterized protein n=1 Tax=Paramecium octaurelia TaxID=43137 RepID=A0A8S1V433_PAROT|nr:unnamed protein product [Paramecium octaurelia]